MSVKHITIEGQKYPVAPLHPESWEYPSPAYPVAVTPEVARSWLAYNYRNRNQRMSGKRDYGSDMAEGSFAINGTTVTFSRPLKEKEDPNVPAGKPCLMDGQHRLQSCVDSNAPFVVYVAYGISPEARQTIDTGIKRTFSDVLMFNDERHSNVLGAVTKRAHAWTHGDSHLTMKKVAATHTALWEFLQVHPELRRSAEVASRAQGEFHLSSGHSLRQSVVGLAHWLFTQACPEEAPTFFARLGDGAEMPLMHPVMALRRRLVKDLTVKQQPNGGTRRELLYIPDWQQMCYYIRTWNVYLDWTVMSQQQRDEFTKFSMVGRLDSQQMPAIKTMEDARHLQALRERNQAHDEGIA